MYSVPVVSCYKKLTWQHQQEFYFLPCCISLTQSTLAQQEPRGIPGTIKRRTVYTHYLSFTIDDDNTLRTSLNKHGLAPKHLGASRGSMTPLNFYLSPKAKYRLIGWTSESIEHSKSCASYWSDKAIVYPLFKIRTSKLRASRITIDSYLQWRNVA